MGFEYGKFVSSGLGKQIANTLGLPRPTTLRRHKAGGSLINGAVLLAGHGDAPVAALLTEALEIARHSPAFAAGLIAAAGGDPEAITGEMYLTRNRRKLLFIDELKQQLGEVGADDPVKAAVVEEAARRARKYGGALLTATQSADDYYGSAQMEAALR